jgi:uncharacterized membrane protein
LRNPETPALSILALIALFATACLFGGMAFFAAVVAPITFKALPAEMAGRFVRTIFPPYYVWVMATAGAGGVALFPLSKPDSGILLVVAGVTFWLRQVLMPRINALSDAAKAGDAEAGRAFDRAHKLSVWANVAQLVAAGVVLAGFVI